MNYMSEGLDVDRLHNVITNIREGHPAVRAEGRTTAYLQLMAAEAEVCDFDATYVYVTYNMNNARSVYDFFQDIMRERSLDLLNGVEMTMHSRARTCVEVNGKLFLFASIQQFADGHMRGIKIDRAFVDVDPRWLDYHQSCNLTITLRELQIAMMHSQGDIL